MRMPPEPETARTILAQSMRGDGRGKLRCHRWGDVGATIASGSYRTLGMVIIPCSMSTVAKLAGGLSSDLLERAADVQMKEGRKLVLVPRETPFSLIHLRNLTTLAEAGVTNCASNTGMVSPSPIDRGFGRFCHRSYPQSVRYRLCGH
jgi:4-hydroxy-3-polyprenylbenzoate decarboxylase